MASSPALSMNRFQFLCAIISLACGSAFASRIERIPVESSNLKSVGYDEKTRVLEIEFHHGGIYRYYDVPADTHSALMKAESKGKYFQSHIRNKFRFEKIGSGK
jgi:hypothetical protein